MADKVLWISAFLEAWKPPASSLEGKMQLCALSSAGSVPWEPALLLPLAVPGGISRCSPLEEKMMLGAVSNETGFISRRA